MDSYRFTSCRCLPQLLVALATLFSFVEGAIAAEPNDQWSEATDLGGTRVVTDRLDFATPGADTTLGVFDENGTLTAVDDDGSFFGNGVASALLDVPVNSDGSVRFAVSGFGDFDFDGLDDQGAVGHTESGDFDAFLTVYDANGQVLDSDTFNETLVPGEAVVFPTQSDPSWVGGRFDIELNNYFGPPSDTDFWQFSSIPAQVPFVAEVVSGEFDSLLGWYDDAGDLIDSDDDGGNPPLSRIEGVTGTSGELYFAVTAFPDFGYGGVHSSTGEYTLRVTLVPEPNSGMAALLLLSLGSVHRTARSSRRRHRR